MEAVARRSLASGWRNAPGMALGVEDFMSNDTDFRNLLADVPPDSALDFVLRDLRHLTHVSKRSLNILVAHRFSLIPGHVEHRRHQCSHLAQGIETAMGPLREVDGFLFSE